MKSRGLVLWISAAALAVAVTVPALAKGDAYTPGVNGVTAPSVLPETRVDPVLPEGVTLTKPVALRVEFVVGTDGAARDIRVRGGKSHAPLVQSTIDALSKWRFEPGTWNGKPVDTLPEIEVRFGDPSPEPVASRMSLPHSGMPLGVAAYGAVIVRGDSVRQWIPPRDRPNMPAHESVRLETVERGTCVGAPGHCVYERPDNRPTRLVGLTQPAPPPAGSR